MDNGFPKGKTRKGAKVERDKNAEVALDLYMKGNNFREIGEVLGFSRQRAHTIVKEELAKASKRLSDLGDGVMVNQVKRLEYVIKLALRDLEKSIEVDYEEDEDGHRQRRTTLVNKLDPQIAQVIFKAQERMSKYLGHDKPEKKEFEVGDNLASVILQSRKVKELPAPVDAEFTEIDSDD